MHFTMDVSAGQLLTILSILVIGVRALSHVRAIEKRFDRVMWEHDMLWREYSRTHKIDTPRYGDDPIL